MSLGEAVVDIVANSSGFKASAKKGVEDAIPSAVTAATNLGRKTGDRISSMISKSVKTGAATFTAVLGTALVKGFQRLDAIDQARKKMEALGHSTKTVETIMDNALASVKGTAFGLGDAAGLAATLVSAGIKPGQALETTLKRVADAATVAGTDLGDMGSIWSKAAAKGRIDGELMNQMIERQIPIFDILGKHYGTSAAEVSKMVTKGKVDFKAFSDAMDAYVGGAALKSGETFRGALANMGAALGRLGANVLSGVFPQMRGAFVDVTKMLDTFGPAAERAGAVLGDAFRRAYAAVSALLTGLTSTDPTVLGAPLEGLAAVGYRVREVFVNIWERVKPVLDGISGLGVTGMAGFGAAVAGVAAKSGTLLPFLTGMAGAFPKISAAVKFLTGPLGLVVGLFAAAYATSEPFREAVNSLMGTLGELAGQVGAALMPVLSDLITGLLPSFQTAVAALIPFITTVADTILPLAVEILPGLLAAATPLLGAFTSLVGVLTPFAPQILALAAAWKTYSTVSGIIRGGLITERLAWVATKRAAVVSMGQTMALRAMYAADAVKKAAMVAGSWTMMGVRALASAGRMAIAWVIAMGPIGWVITALVALGAGLVLLWNKSETFRDIVTGAWEGIKAGVGAVVSFFTDTVWPGIQAVWDGIVSGLTTAWNAIAGVFNAIIGFLSSTFGPWLRTYLAIWEFVFKAIVILVLAAWELGIKPVFNWIVEKLGEVGAWFVGLYNDYVKPAFTAVVTFLTAVWNASIKVILTAIQTALGWLGDKFTWLHRNVIVPVWNGIKAALASTWAWIKANVFDRITQAVGWLGDRFNWFQRSVMVPVWAGIKATVRSVTDYITNTVFAGFKRAIDSVATKFEEAKKAIGTAWGALQELAKKPIKFVIDKVLNGGLVKGFNWLSDKIGGPKIDPIPMPFRDGGILPGYTPGRDVHEFFSPTGGRLRLSGGEPILRPEAGRVLGGGWVSGINAAARRSGTAGVNRFLSRGSGGGQAFASGGVFGWIKSKAAGAFDWMRNKAGAIWEAVSNPGKYLLSKIPALDSVKTIAKYGEAAVLKTKDSLVEKVKGLWSSFTGAFTKVESERSATAGALPADAKGLTFRSGVRLDQDTIARLVVAAKSAAMRVIQGSWQNYHLSGGTHLGAGAADIHAANWGAAVSALRRAGMLAMFRNWPDNQHIHAINPNIGGLSAAARGQVATARRNNGNFKRGGVLPLRSYDNGGYLEKGWTLAHNGTGAREPVGHDLGGTTYLTVNMEVSMKELDDLRSMGAFLRMLETSRVERRRTARSGPVSA